MIKNIDLIILEQTREKVTRLEKSMRELTKQMQSLVDERSQVQKNCNHVLGVKLKDYSIEDDWSEAYCLNCNAHFTGPIITIERIFQNIIHFEYLTFDGEQLADEVKVEIALEMFRHERANHPELSDAEIVANINEQIKSQTTSVEEQQFVKSIGAKKSYQ